MLSLILLCLIVILILGTIPSWPYSRQWGYRLSGILSALLIILILLILIGYIPFLGIKEPIIVFPKGSSNTDKSLVIVPEKTNADILTPDTITIEKTQKK
jgi:hypothetical protein